MKLPLAISGILFSFSLAQYIDNKGYKFFGGIIDGEYYQIYLLSWFAQQFIGIFYKIGLINYVLCSFLMFFTPFIFTKIVCFIINKYLYKFKIFIGM